MASSRNQKQRYAKGHYTGYLLGRKKIIEEIEEKFADQYGRIMIRIDSKEWEGFKKKC